MKTITWVRIVLISFLGVIAAGGEDSVFCDLKRTLM